MATITSAGVGSGLDVNSLVNQLVAAEGQPATRRLDIKEARLQAELTAWGTLKGALSTFQSSLAGLKNTTTFSKRAATVSDSTVLTASTTSAAKAGSYSLEVSALAKAHSLSSSASFANVTDSVGTGTLTFRFGTWSGTPGSYAFEQNAAKAEKSITIDASNNTLAGLRDAINAQNFGVQASIVNDGSGYRLVLTSKDTGAANAMEISVGSGTGELANFNFTAASRNDADPSNDLTQNIAAQNAAFTINGLGISSASNTVADAIPGVTLALKKETGGTPVSVEVTQDKSAVSKAINDFVTGYNTLVDSIGKLTSYDAKTGQAGTLLGDASVRGVQRSLRNLLNQQVSGVSGPYSTLAELGITTDSTGKLQINEGKLDTALTNNFDDITGLFTAWGKPSDPLVSYVSATSATKAGNYAVNVTQAATQGNFTGNTGITSLTLNSGNKTFALKVDGVSSGTITLNEGTYDSDNLLASLATQMQSKINGDSALSAAGVAVTVTYDTANDRFVLTSTRYGSSSKVEVIAQNTDLGLDGSGTATTGVNVAGSIGGVTATGSGRYLTGTGDASGLMLEVLGTGTGSRGSVSFARGVVGQIDGLLTGYLASEGIITARTDGMQDSIDDITEQRETLARRLEALEQRYMAQFTALDALLGQMQSTSSYLTQQLASLPGAYSRSKS